MMSKRHWWWAGAPSALLVSALAGLAYAQSPEPPLPSCTTDAGTLLKTQQISLPAMGLDSEVEVGQPMVSSIRADVRGEAPILEKEAEFKARCAFQWARVVILPGPLKDVGDFHGLHPADYKVFREDGREVRFGRPDVAVRLRGGDPPGLEANFNVIGAGTEYPVDGAQVSVSKCLDLGRRGYRRELLYSGVSQGTISLQYREFSDNLARPAFSQELKYDLKEGDEIGFRGARFKILKATNASVKYMVLKPLE